MDSRIETLQVELEDVGGSSWWAGLLTTLASQSGSATLRFVGTVDGERRYAGATFVAPRWLGPVAPQEAWAPGMTRCLAELRQDLQRDGWVEVSRGKEPWALRYERAVVGTCGDIPGERTHPRR